MKNEDVNPSEDTQDSEANESSLKSRVERKDHQEEMQDSFSGDPSSFSNIDEDEMIVVLEDSDSFSEDITLETGDDLVDPVSDEFEDLPEVSVELVDDLPEVEDVDEITSLVEEVDIDFTDGLDEAPSDVMGQIRDWAVENWKPAVVAASLLFTVGLLISSLSTGVSADGNAAASAANSENAAVGFENWVDEVLDQHLVGIGTEEK